MSRTVGHGIASEAEQVHHTPRGARAELLIDECERRLVWIVSSAWCYGKAACSTFSWTVDHLSMHAPQVHRVLEDHLCFCMRGASVHCIKIHPGRSQPL